jgi:alcohol dehydrogenase (cytochrome c)
MFRISRLAPICFLLLVGPLLAAQSKESTSTGANNIADGDWPNYDRNYTGDRYSPLSEITAKNVTTLQPLCTYDSGTKTGFETGLVAVSGTLFFTTLDSTFAIDAANCKLRWKQTQPLSAAERVGLGVNRGVAFADGKVFRGFDDGNVMAIDAATGKPVWNTRIADKANGETIPAAPLAWSGMLFIGNAGGDNFGVTGRIYALDANTGKILWQFDTVPSTGPVASTWTKKSAENPPTGGATWTSYHVDPASGVLWLGTGNVAPDFILAMHPGDNLYTSSILALDAKTGMLLAYIQPVKHDFHDWDMATPPVVITTRGGRKLAVASGKDGIVYGIDRGSVEAGGSTSNPKTLRIEYQTVATTRSNVDAPLTSTEFTRFCPGSQGGAEWNGPAYSPAENLAYVPEIDWCTSVKLAPVTAMKGGPGKVWSGAHDESFGKQDPIEQWSGWVTAIDADSGRVAWQYHAPTPVTAAIAATAGGLVFSADMDGNVVALDARSGKKLWSHNTGQPVGGGVVTYEAGGHQRLAVAAGLSSSLWPKQGESGRIVVYGLK